MTADTTVAGQITFAGTASVAAYQALLRSVTYTNTSDNPSPAARSVAFVVTDDGGLPSPAATRAVAVSPANDAPVVVLSGSTPAFTEGGLAVAVDAGLTVADPDSNVVGATVSITGGFAAGQDVLAVAGPLPAGVTAAYNGATGVLTLSGSATPAAYQSLLQSVTYANTSANPSVTPRTVSVVVSDGSLSSAPVTTTVTVAAVDTPPTANPDAYTTLEDASVSGNVLANDTDPDGPALTASVVGGGPANGALALNPDGSFTYTPNANYFGPDSFQYKANDGTSDSNTVTVTLTVKPVNDAPSFAGSDQTAVEDNGGAALAVSVPGWAAFTAGPANESGQTATYQVQVLSGAGLFTAGPAVAADGTLTYTLAANANGTAAFRVRVADSGGTLNGGTDTSAWQTFTLTVRPVADLPVVPAPTTAEDMPVTVAVSPAAVDAASGSVATPVGFFRVTAVAGGTVFKADGVTPVVNGQYVTVAEAGSLVFKPAADANSTATPGGFHFDVAGAHDANGSGLGPVATVNITVMAVNDAPVAVADSFTTAEDTPLTVLVAAGVLANDTDVDGPTLTAAVATGPAHGTLALNPNGSFTYTPALNYNGPDSFTYTVSDGNGGTATGTVSLTVTPVNDAPVAAADSYTTAEDAPLTVGSAAGLLANDADVDGPTLAAVLVTGPAHGLLTLNPNGTFTYTPAANYNGPDSFTYKANDGSADSNTVAVTLTVTAVNDAPTAAPAAVTTAEDTAVVIDLATLVSDVETPTAGLTFTVSGATNGTVMVVGSVATFTPAADYFGPASFSYTVTDGGDGASPFLTATNTVSVTVTAVNDAPTLAPITAVTVLEDAGLTTVALTGIGTGAGNEAQTLVVTAVSNNPGLVTGLAVTYANPAAGGSVTFTPAANASGTATVTVTVNDGQALVSQSFTVTVTAVNDVPVAAADAYTVAEDGTLTVAAAAGVLANDADIDGPTLTAVQVTGPAHGTLALAADGSFTYTPAADYNGPDSFTYKVNDGAADGNTVAVSLTVTPVNDAPVAIDDTATVLEDGSVVVSVLANDTFAPDVGETLTVTGVSQGSHGAVTFTAAGVTYTPAANTNGPDSFTYTISDGNGGTATATVNVTVTARERRAGGGPGRLHGGRGRHTDGRVGGRRAGQRRGHRRADAGGRPSDRAGPRDARAGRGRELHVYPGRRLQRAGLVHVQGERRGGRRRHGDRVAHRHPGERQPDRGRRRGHGGRGRVGRRQRAGQRLGRPGRQRNAHRDGRHPGHPRGGRVQQRVGDVHPGRQL